MGVGAGWWRTELALTYWFPRRETVSGDASAGAELDLWSGGARGCGVPRVGAAVQFPLCAGIELGPIRARGFGEPDPRDVRSWWVAVVLGPAVAWAPRPWLALWAGVEGSIALRRPGFTRPGGPALFRAAPVGVRVLGGLEFRIRAP